MGTDVRKRARSRYADTRSTPCLIRTASCLAPRKAVLPAIGRTEGLGTKQCGEARLFPLAP